MAEANAISNKLIIMLGLVMYMPLSIRCSPEWSHFTHCFIQLFLGKKKTTLCSQGHLAAALRREVRNNVSNCKKCQP